MKNIPTFKTLKLNLIWFATKNVKIVLFLAQKSFTCKTSFIEINPTYTLLLQ